MISVVIPVYNGSNYMNDAIESVLNQTYKNIEIIVVDDGSTDNTWEIIQSYGNLIRGFHKENGGVSSALNLGLEKMMGDWFAWLSHDDLWLPEKIEKQVDYISQHPDVQICYTGTNSINQYGNIIGGSDGIWYPPGKDIQQIIRKRNYISGITPIISKNCFQNVGPFREDYRYGQDMDMWIRLMCQYKFGLIPERLASGRVHSMQVGTRMPKKCLDEYKIIINSYLSKEMYPYYFPDCNSACLLSIKGRIFLLVSHLYLDIVNPIKYVGLSLAAKYLPRRIKNIIKKCLPS